MPTGPSGPAAPPGTGAGAGTLAAGSQFRTSLLGLVAQLAPQQPMSCVLAETILQLALRHAEAQLVLTAQPGRDRAALATELLYLFPWSCVAPVGHPQMHTAGIWSYYTPYMWIKPAHRPGGHVGGPASPPLTQHRDGPELATRYRFPLRLDCSRSDPAQAATVRSAPHRSVISERIPSIWGHLLDPGWMRTITLGPAESAGSKGPDAHGRWDGPSNPSPRQIHLLGSPPAPVPSGPPSLARARAPLLGSWPPPSSLKVAHPVLCAWPLVPLRPIRYKLADGLAPGLQWLTRDGGKLHQPLARQAGAFVACLLSGRSPDMAPELGLDPLVPTIHTYPYHGALVGLFGALADQVRIVGSTPSLRSQRTAPKSSQGGGGLSRSDFAVAEWWLAPLPANPQLWPLNVPVPTTGREFACRIAGMSQQTEQIQALEAALTAYLLTARAHRYSYVRWPGPNTPFPALLGQAAQEVAAAIVLGLSLALEHTYDLLLSTWAQSSVHLIYLSLALLQFQAAIATLGLGTLNTTGAKRELLRLCRQFQI